MGATDVGQVHKLTQQTVILASYVPILLATISLKKMWNALSLCQLWYFTFMRTHWKVSYLHTKYCLKELNLLTSSFWWIIIKYAILNYRRKANIWNYDSGWRVVELQVIICWILLLQWVLWRQAWKISNGRSWCGNTSWPLAIFTAEIPRALWY